jgi:hypothetical protein
MGIPTLSAGGPFAPEKMEARVGYRRPGPGLDRARERGTTKKLRFGQNNKDVRNVYFAVILLRSATTAFSLVKVPQKLLSEIELRFKIRSQRNSFSRAERMVPLNDCGSIQQSVPPTQG